MTPATLQALRRLLFFSRPEAALLVAASQDRPRGVSDRAWRQWEAGEFAVPHDVSIAILNLAKWRKSAINDAIDIVVNKTASTKFSTNIALIWYEKLDDWATLPEREPILWRPQQSVCAALLAEFPGRLSLVQFDTPAYASWLQGRADNETMRSAWATETMCKN